MKPIHDSAGARVRHYTRTAVKRRKPNAHPEHDFQVEVIGYLRWVLPEPYEALAMPMGVNVGRYRGSLMKAAGATAGWSDIFIVNMDTSACRFLELKVGKNDLSKGQATKAQRLGRFWRTAWTLEDVEAAIIGWGIKPRYPIPQANRYGAGVG